jgi:hypothetical protein
LKTSDLSRPFGNPFQKMKFCHPLGIAGPGEPDIRISWTYAIRRFCPDKNLAITRLQPVE